MKLEDGRIAEVLDAGPAEALRRIDDHVMTLAHRATQARETAAAVKTTLGSAPRSRSVRVNGSVFTAAAEQVLTATIHDQGFPVLNGVHIEVTAGEVVLTATDRYRTRVLISRNALLRALEEQHDQRVRLRISDSALTVSSKGKPVTAVVTGPPLGIEFAVSTLHPAISSAVGPDVMLDLAGKDQPAVVRSADDGDFTTLAMPVMPHPPEGSER